jgi:pteridine reductase
MPASRPVALVTGGARRIGAAIVARLHAAGFDVAIHHRDSVQAAQDLAARLETVRAGSTLLLQGELADDSTAPRLVAEVLDRRGRLNALVNNASAFFPTPFGETTPALWDALFASNARAPFFLAQAAAPALRAAGGAIVNLADVHGETPLRAHAPYSAAKAALLMLTRALALELAPEVRVNAVAPGAVLWPDQGKPEAEREALLARTPLARLGRPEEIAEAVRWLLQDATYMSGQTLRLDGGRSLTG